MYSDDSLGTPEYWKASEKARKLYHKLRAKQAKRASDGIKQVKRNRNKKKVEGKRTSLARVNAELHLLSNPYQNDFYRKSIYRKESNHEYYDKRPKGTNQRN